MNLLNKICFCVLSYLILVLSLEADIVTRGAFDVGSNVTKLCIAGVDEETNQIVKVYYNNEKEVSLRGELSKSKDGKLSIEIENKLIDGINELIAEAASFSPTQFFGIGTSVFRLALNGQNVLKSVKEKTGVTIHLASQEEEGLIGFLTAVAASQKKSEEIISWDIGSSSFQIAASIDDEIVMYGSEFAYVPSAQILFINMRGLDQISRKVNPVSYKEIVELSERIRPCLPLCPEWLLKKNKQVIGIGGTTSVFSNAYIATGKNPYSKEDIKKTFTQIAEKMDQDLCAYSKPHEVVVSLVLLYTMMDHCGINQVTYQSTNGSCTGVLMMPQYWK